MPKIDITPEVKLSVKLAVCVAPFVSAAVALVILALLTHDLDGRLRLLGLALAPSTIALYLYERLCSRAKLKTLADHLEEYEIERDVQAAIDHYRQEKAHREQGANVLSIVHLLPGRPRDDQLSMKTERS